VNGVRAADAQWNVKTFRMGEWKTSPIVAFIIVEGNLHGFLSTVGVEDVLSQRLASTQFHFITTVPKSMEALDEIDPANEAF